MPDPSAAPEDRFLREAVAAWAQEHVAPRAAAMEAAGRIPDDIHEAAADQGLTGLLVPRDHGGAGLTTRQACAALAGLGTADGAVVLSLGAHNVLACNAMLEAGDPDQRARWLPPLAAGDALGAWALTEPGAGSDAPSIRTTARRDDGDWVLDGEKCFITNGSRADVVVVTARLDEGGFGTFVATPDDPGFQAASAHDLVCMGASDTASITLDACRLPGDRLLGEPGDGLLQAFSVLDLERVTMAAILAAGARQDLQEALDRARDPETGAGPATDPATYRPLAQLSARVEAAETLWRRAATARDRGDDHRADAARAKILASELAQDAARTALAVAGPEGLERAARPQRALRDSLLGTIGGGTTAMQEILVARGLGIDADPYRA